jgi:hypothetical protein
MTSSMITEYDYSIVCEFADLMERLNLKTIDYEFNDKYEFIVGFPNRNSVDDDVPFIEINDDNRNDFCDHQIESSYILNLNYEDDSFIHINHYYHNSPHASMISFCVRGVEMMFHVNSNGKESFCPVDDYTDDDTDDKSDDDDTDDKSEYIASIDKIMRSVHGTANDSLCEYFKFSL